MTHIHYNPKQHQSFKTYVLGFLATDENVEASIRHGGSRHLDTGRLLDKLPSPVPMSTKALVTSFKEAVDKQQLESWLYAYINNVIEYWLDAEGHFKPEFMTVLQQRRTVSTPSLYEELYCTEGSEDANKTAIAAQKFIGGMVKNLIEVVEPAIRNTHYASDSEKEDAIGKYINQALYGMPASIDALEVEKELANPNRVYLNQYISDMHVSSSKVITLTKMREYQQAKRLKKSDAVEADSYSTYLKKFLRNATKLTCLTYNEGREIELSRLTNDLTHFLPASIDSLWQSYKKAIDNDDLQEWVYSHVDAVCQYWLDEQGRFKPELLQIFAERRRLYFQQSINEKQQELKKVEPNSSRASELQGKIKEFEHLRDQDISEFLYGLNGEKTDQVAKAFISGVIMRLEAMVSSDFLQKVGGLDFSNSNYIKYIWTPISDPAIPLPTDDDPDLDETKSVVTDRLIISSFAQRVGDDRNSYTIDLGKLKNYRQEKNMRSIEYLPKQQPTRTSSTKEIINTLGQLGFIGGGLISLVGFGLLVSGVGSVAGVAVLLTGVSIMGISTATVAATDARETAHVSKHTKEPKSKAPTQNQEQAQDEEYTLKRGVGRENPLSKILVSSARNSKPVNYDESSGSDDDEIRVERPTQHQVDSELRLKETPSLKTWFLGKFWRKGEAQDITPTEQTSLVNKTQRGFSYTHHDNQPH